MEAKELKKIAKQMKLLGITHLKTADLELTMAPEALTKVAPIQEPKAAPEKELTPEEQKEIEHKIEQVKALYLGSDEDLLDRLFPVPVEEKESA